MAPLDDGSDRSAESLHLHRLAVEMTGVYLEHTQPDAVLLTGSAATGDADRFSDLDLILYYVELPPGDAASAAREVLGAHGPAEPAARTDDAFMEFYDLRGVQCQVVHETIAGWEEELRTVLVDLDVESPLQKAVAGLFEGIALHNEDLIDQWRRSAVYPDALSRAMVERYWRFYPLWHVQQRLAARDALLWRQQVLVESAYNLLGALAGLNRRWFTTFQFKRAHAFAARLEIAPARLADRLDELFRLDGAAAIADLEALVAETQALLARHMPDFDASLSRGPGSREQPWAP
jgi:predicted nucleotidyltransferase